ncbi:hypothetical protein, partial [Salmonella sp. s51944]|uniref:hypothetical protein n=1 Tax=Salmonella sp. s51944 TaxID=3159655 RepID=UPI00397ECA0C
SKLKASVSALVFVRGLSLLFCKPNSAAIFNRVSSEIDVAEKTASSSLELKTLKGAKFLEVISPDFAASKIL